MAQPDPRFQLYFHPIFDPGPEVFEMMHTVPEERRLELLQVISEAQATLNTARAEAYKKIGDIAGAARQQK